MTDANDRPVRRATVSLDPANGGAQVLQAHTDEQGRFRIEHLAPGPELFRVGFGADGFARAKREFTVADDGAVATLNVRLEPALRIEGRAAYSDGRPASGVYAIATRLDDPWAERSSLTGDDGRFRIVEIASGRHRLRLLRGTRLLGTEELDVPPGGLATPLEIRIPVATFGARRVRVVVLDPRGAPVADAGVRLSAWTRLTDSEGHADFTDVEPVVATVAATKAGFLPAGREVDLTVGDADVTLAFGSGVAEGRVVSTDGRGLRADVFAQWKARHEEDALPDSDLVFPSDDAGRFRITGLGEGEYQLTVRARESGELSRGPVVHAGQTGVEVRVVERRLRDFVVLPVDARDGKPVTPPGMIARLRRGSEFVTDAIFITPVPGVAGEYRGTFPEGVEPGEYTLAVGAEPPYTQRHMEGVRIAPELGPYRFTVAFDVGSSLTGRVTWADGRPAAGARIISKGPGVPDERARAPIFAKPDGTFRIDGLEDGPCVVFVLERYAVRAERTIVVGPASPGSCDLTIEPAGAVRLVFPDVHPRTKAEVTLTPTGGGDARTLASDRADGEVFGVRPGGYRANVVWDGEAAGSADVTIVAGETTSIVLPLR